MSTLLLLLIFLFHIGIEDSDKFDTLKEMIFQSCITKVEIELEKFLGFNVKEKCENSLLTPKQIEELLKSLPESLKSELLEIAMKAKDDNDDNDLR